MPVLSDDDSLLNFTVADFAAYYGGGGGPTPPDPKPPTGATPGGWTPPGSDVPPTGPPTVPANPTTAWTEGQSVTTGDGQEWYWDGTAWQNGTAPAPTPPDPHIDTIEPDTTPAGELATIVVTGSNFDATSVIEINGTEINTTFDSATQLTGTATPQVPGSPKVSVRNGSDMESNELTLTVTAADPVDPVITTLSPDNALADAGDTTVTVNGSGFVSGSTVEVDQVAVPTTYVSDTELTAVYTVSGTGTYTFTVRNPSTKESNDVTFSVIETA